MNNKKMFYALVLAVLLCSSLPVQAAAPHWQADNPNPPANPVKLIFIHHSTGGNWLADPNSDQPYGGLGIALRDNNYFVSATNYGWGPDAIGDRTDIPNWPEWFTGPNSSTFMEAVYGETGQNFGDFGSWSRLDTDPGGENEIIMFKSCFPNSDLYGSPGDPPASEPNDEFTVSNAKAVYNNILTYFATRQDRLFVVITAPPLQQSETEADRAANARAFNNWLVNEWLGAYPYKNVAVFDYYNVLTDPNNHHRWQNGQIEHVQAGKSNFSAYPSGDSHPSTAGDTKATAEFVPLLNVFYNRWKNAPAVAPAPTSTPKQAAAATVTPTPAQEAAPTPTTATTARLAGQVNDFETDTGYHTEGEQADLNITLDNTTMHSGASSLRFEFDVQPGGWGGVWYTFDPLQDLSSGAGSVQSTALALWVHAEPAGRGFTMVLFSGDPAAPTPFEVYWETPPEAADGWVQVILPWETFAKPEWAGSEGIPALDLTRITSWGISVGDAEGAQNKGTLWIDDMALLTGDIQPIVEPTSTPVQAAAPTDTPAQPTPTAKSAPPTYTPEAATPADTPVPAEAKKGLCGSAAVLSLLVILAAWLSWRR